jgi:hypothetical protein
MSKTYCFNCKFESKKYNNILRGCGHLLCEDCEIIKKNNSNIYFCYICNKKVNRCDLKKIKFYKDKKYKFNTFNKSAFNDDDKLYNDYLEIVEYLNILNNSNKENIKKAHFIWEQLKNQIEYQNKLDQRKCVNFKFDIYNVIPRNDTFKLERQKNIYPKDNNRSLFNFNENKNEYKCELLNLLKKNNKM